MNLYRPIQLLALACCTALPAAESFRSAYKKEPGPLKVETLELDWTDNSRTRRVPAKVYLPATGSGPFPIIIYSHGLGGTRESYEYLGRHWASHGYVSVHVQHLGSDDTVWRGLQAPMKTMQAAAANLRNAIARPLDVRFAIDQVLQLASTPGPLRGRLDTNHIGMAGHSFGAYTTLAIAGQVLGREEHSLGDARVKAAIAMSSPAPKQDADRAFSQIKIPIFHMTGTEDNSPIGNTSPRERRVPFDNIGRADQYLVTFTGGDHMVFSGRSGMRGQRNKDEVFHSLILQSSTAFWDAYLKDDKQAKQWLANGGFERALGKEGVFEKKTGR